MSNLLALAVVVLGFGLAGTAVARRLDPEAQGACRLLGAAVSGLAVAVLLGELLGTFEALRRPLLVVTAALVGLAGGISLRRDAAAGATGAQPAHQVQTSGAEGRTDPAWGDEDRMTRVAVGTSFAAASLLAFRWCTFSAGALDRGMSEIDSMQYHLPIAATFVAAHSTLATIAVWSDPVHQYYPANGELLDALTMASTGNDRVIPLLPLAWLGLMLVAAWVAGRQLNGRRGGAVAVAGLAAVLATPILTVTSAATAGTDLPSTALGLAAVALALRHRQGRGVVVLAGLAAGLAVGAKLTSAGLVLVALALVLRGSSTPIRRASVFVGAALLGGGYWFVRNTVWAHFPVPQEAPRWIGGPSFPAYHYFSASILSRISGARLPLTVSTPLWDMAHRLALTAAVGAVALVRGWRRVTSWLVGGAVLCGLLYVVNPLSAAGFERIQADRVQVAANTRYLLPAAALVILAAASVRAFATVAALFTAAFAGLVMLGLTRDRNATLRLRVLDPVGLRLAGTVALGIAGVTVIVAALTIAHRRRWWGLAGGAVALVAGGLLCATQVGAASGPGLLTGERPDAALGAVLDSLRSERVGLEFTLVYPFLGPGWTRHAEQITVPLGPHDYRLARTCREWVTAVQRGRYDHVVIEKPGSPEFYWTSLVRVSRLTWALTQPGARVVATAGDGKQTLLALGPSGRLDPERCGSLPPDPPLWDAAP